MAPGVPLFEARGVSKHFAGVRALQDVDLRIDEGEVLAVIGENGAGKSTLMKILAGIEQPDAGRLTIGGREVIVESTRVAMNLGIALIHQELNLADNLDVGANIYLGREPNRAGWIRETPIEEGACRVLGDVGADFGPRTLVRDLSIGQQQLVEIAKALSLEARILIMDEPTSSLSQLEAERLFGVVQGLRRRGVSVIYISHRLGEVSELADRVVVLRDGMNSGELGRDEIEHDAMVQLMVGREVLRRGARRARVTGTVALEAERLVVPSHPESSVTLTIAAGEVVGIAGLVGAGRTELLRVLFGIDRPLGGTLRLFGRELRLRGPADAIRSGMALVPEDRKQQALFLEMGVRENTSLASLRRHRAGILDRAMETRLCREMIERLGIDTSGSEQAVQDLSGGNQQKVVLGRWLALEPRVLLLDEPTRGIDVGARQEIYALIDRLAEDGVAVLFASSEMEEVLTLPDRVLVMHEGRIAGELAAAELDEESVMRLATGGVSHP